MVVDEWNRQSHPMKKDPYGVFEVVVPAKDGQPAIAHNSKIKVCHLHLQPFSSDKLDFHDHTIWRTNRAHSCVD